MSRCRANILVACTKRKKQPVSHRLRLRGVRRGDPVDVAQRWSQRLAESSVVRVSGVDLYAGDHWKIATELPALANEFSVPADLWVVSAGYGLVPAGAHLAPYSATFSDGDPDAVFDRLPDFDRAAALAVWWRALTECRGPVAESPRSIEALARSSPRSPIVVIASPKYLNAIEADLIQARRSLGRPDQLIIISAGGRGKGLLAENTLHCSADYQGTLGGSLMSLNVRVARWLVSNVPETPWTVGLFEEALQQLPKSDKAKAVPKRAAMSDAEVCRFIDEAFQNEDGLRHSSLLRRYRDAGYACEQKRFSRLFKEVEARYG